MTKPSTPISRSDHDAGLVELSDVDSGQRLAQVHPGKLLRHPFPEPLALWAHALALALRVPANRISAILASRRSVTAETALRLARHFSASPAFWLSRRKAWEREQAKREAGAHIRAQAAPHEAA